VFEVDLRADIEQLRPELIALRRSLHQHPELAFEEVWTAATLAGRMRELGLAVQEGLGGTGVLAILDGARPGKTLLIRSDIDGLPMPDTTGREYSSLHDNRSHACGHDAHSAMVAGVAAVLARHRKRLAGRLAVVFQPGDEPMRGAKRMIDDGLLERIAPNMSLSVHVLPMINVGEVVIQSGPIWASRDELTLTLSTPASVDVTRIAAQITTALYDLVEKEGTSRDGVTFRVRSVRAEQSGPAWLGGSRGEPDGAVVEVNLALYDNGLRAHLLGRISEVAEAIVSAGGGMVVSEVDYALPALVNDDRVASVVAQAARSVIGAENIHENWRNEFSDDFGLFMAAAPGCLMLLGTANPAKGITEIWHRSGFDIDEDVLSIGVEIMSLAALALLQ
jgi:amidohydrolase